MRLRLAKGNGRDKAHILSYLRTKYQSENRTKEAAIVDKLIFEEEADAVRKYDES